MRVRVLQTLDDVLETIESSLQVTYVPAGLSPKDADQLGPGFYAVLRRYNEQEFKGSGATLAEAVQRALIQNGLAQAAKDPSFRGERLADIQIPEHVTERLLEDGELLGIDLVDPGLFSSESPVTLTAFNPETIAKSTSGRDTSLSRALHNFLRSIDRSGPSLD